MKKQTSKMLESKTIAKTFDPFNDRLSRDIRNSLSEAFCTAVDQMKKIGYRDEAEKWLATNPGDVYCAYIQDRLVRYDRVFDKVRIRDLEDPFLQVLVIWNNELFFEVHEHLEPIWYRATGDQRQSLKGLIKAAGVYIHMERNHMQAAKSLSIKSLELIQQYHHCLTFISNLDMLMDKLKTLDPVPPKLKNPEL